MSRRNRRNLIFYSVLLVALAGSLWVFWYRWPILYPYSYFDHRETYDGFTLYSDEPPEEGFGETIREVRLRMSCVEGYGPEETYPVFACRRSCYERFARQMGVNPFSQGLTIEPMGYAVINLQDIGMIENTYSQAYHYTLARGDPAHIIAHELVHLVTTGRLGIWRTVTLPTWKEEGYAEYAASRYTRHKNPDYSLRNRVLQYLDGYYRAVGRNRLEYIRAGLAVEYLLDERRLGFEEVMNGTFEFEEILTEMEEWARSG